MSSRYEIVFLPHFKLRQQKSVKIFENKDHLERWYILCSFILFYKGLQRAPYKNVDLSELEASVNHNSNVAQICL